jgi:hypothetical protein
MIISSKNQNDFNSYLLEIIKASVKHAEDNNNICLTEYFPQTNFNYIDRISSKKFYNIKINMLDFSESDTFFTSQFIKEIQGILYSPSNFLKLSKKPRLLFQTQLNNLCLREFEWKTFNKKLVRTAKLDEFTQHFEKEFLIFLKEIKQYMFRVEKISTRKAKLYFQ